MQEGKYGGKQMQEGIFTLLMIIESQALAYCFRL